MARSPAVTRPSPKAEALATLQTARKLLAESPTPFMLRQLDAFLAHVGVQVDQIEETKRARRVMRVTHPVVKGPVAT
jgi:hypothetical protein